MPRDWYPINTKKAPLGFFTQREARPYLGLSATALADALKSGYVPAECAEKLIDMGTLAVLPIDEPPSAGVIGCFANSALKALMHGDYVVAIAHASLGMQTRPMEWATGAPLCPNPLQHFSARLAYSYAWAKNPHSSELKCGLPAIRELHRDVQHYMEKHSIDHRSKDWNAWKYLSAMTLGGTLCYFVMVLGKGWFVSERQADRLKDRAYRRAVAQRVLKGVRHMNVIRPMFGTQRNATVRVAWNIAQLAALAGDTQLFREAVQVLRAKLRQNFDAALEALRDDEDTGPMLAGMGDAA